MTIKSERAGCSGLVTEKTLVLSTLLSGLINAEKTPLFVENRPVNTGPNPFVTKGLVYVFDSEILPAPLTILRSKTSTLRVGEDFDSAKKLELLEKNVN